MKKFLIITILTVSFIPAFSQKKKTAKKPAKTATSSKAASDTLIPGKTVIVTSEFAPVLKSASKINFNADGPAPDTTLPVLQYDIPAQNITFTYLSPPLKPLSQQIDSVVVWDNKSFVKLGYGNYTTPYLQAGLSMGDGSNSILNVYGKYTSSKGPIPFQQFSKTSLEGIGIFSSPDQHHEWTGKLQFEKNNQYLYGFAQDSLNPVKKDDIRQNFTSFGGLLKLRNKTLNDLGINYEPSAGINFFADNHSGTESSFSLDAPVTKEIIESVNIDLALSARLVSFKNSNESINNNLYWLKPAVRYETGGLKLTGGFTPSWDNSHFSLLPNFTAEAKLNEENFVLQAGWIGYYKTGTYESLAAFNPYIQQPSTLLNTRIKEQYAGFKGAAGPHITYGGKVSYLQINNQPLFLNDSLTGRSFRVVYEPSLKALQLHGEIGYTMQEKFSLLGGLDFRQYSSLEINEKAWGLIPMEISGSLRWWIIKDVLLKSDVFFKAGSPYLNKQKEAKNLSPAADLNLGLEVRITPAWSAWLQFNNVLNNKYQRWNQYETLGFNVLGGIIYNFGDLRTAMNK